MAEPTAKSLTLVLAMHTKYFKNSSGQNMITDYVIKTESDKKASEWDTLYLINMYGFGREMVKDRQNHRLKE